MAKNRKANDALWMAILQMLHGGDQNESAAVATAAMSDIKRDKADQDDIHNIVANTMYAQKNDPISFIVDIFDLIYDSALERYVLKLSIKYWFNSITW